MEVLFREHKNVVLHDSKPTISDNIEGSYWLVQEDRREEVIEHFSDFGMLRDILVVLLHQLDFASGQVSQYLVVKVHIGLHWKL